MRRTFLSTNINKRMLCLAVALVVAMGGVTFALLQSQVKLKGNSIQTGTTGLLISPNDLNYNTEVTGFNFTGIIPGAQASQTATFLLKNTGNSPLALKFAAANPPANPSNVDLSKVQVILTPFNEHFMPGTPLTFSLQSLIDAEAAGGLPINYPVKLSPSTKHQFNIQVGMDADAVNGSSAAISNVDFVFTGVAAGN